MRTCAGIKTMKLFALTDTATLRGLQLSDGNLYWSVHDFITFVCDRQTHDAPQYAQKLLYRLMQAESPYREELFLITHKLKLSKSTKPTYVMNVKGLFRLTDILGTKVRVEQREIMIKHFGSETGEKIQDASTLEKLVDSGTLRASMDPGGKQFFSVFDFIQCVCCKQTSSYSRNLLRRLLEDGSEHREALLNDMIYVKFEGQGQRPTPCLGKHGLGRLCSVLGSRLKSRYVGMVETDMMLC